MLQASVVNQTAFLLSTILFISPLKILISCAFQNTQLAIFQIGPFRRRSANDRIKLVPESSRNIDGHSILNIHIRSVWAGIILFQHYIAITCIHERQNQSCKNVLTLRLPFTTISCVFSIVINSTPYHLRIAPKTICLNNACASVTISGTTETRVRP